MINTEDINIRDPFVLVHQGQYYLYGTRGATCWGPADGFDVYAGRDLRSWDGPAVCFRNDGSFWADRNYWAPEVHPWRNMFYMFASFKSDSRRRGTTVLRSASPLGPFEPWSDGPVTPADWECLDGTFHVASDGTPYMVFCHEWVQAGDGEILAVRLTEDLKAAAGKPFLLFRGSDAAWSRPVRHSSGISGYVTDGPFLWRRDDGTLLCLWSGFSEKGYAQGLAVSDTNEIDGHFSQAEPLFLEDGGHGMLFRTPEGRTYLALHSPNTHLLERPRFIPVDL
ncbi:MAG: family 43 glycosylhydrolase [Clostridia bacterium]|nr:family 43 glycosylhydrolase [Clostridia bacterium]